MSQKIAEKNIEFFCEMRWFFISLALMLPFIILSFIACDNGQGQNQNVLRATTTAKIAANTPYPFDHALSILGLKHADLIRPLYYEEGYHLFARNPLVDYVAQSPLYLQKWADETSRQLQDAAQIGLFDTLSLAMAALNGGVFYKNLRRPATQNIGAADAYRLLCDKYGKVPDDLVLSKIKQAGFSAEFNQQLGGLIGRLTQSALLTRKAFAALSREELLYLGLRPERYFFPDGRQFSFLTAATHTQNKIISITRKIDFVSLFTSALVISEAVDGFSRYIADLADPAVPANFFSDANARAGVILNIPSPLGNIIIAGMDNDVHSATAALFVDLGGNDRYNGPVATGHLAKGRVSLAIDVGGNDIYNHQPQQASQGFGCLSVGMLVDLSGDDQYRAGDMAQASGIYGIGVIADFKGDDSYRMGLMGQGFGVFGVGLLLDADGNDKYLISGMGQGTGSTMGIGVLCDIRGNDKYLADRTQKNGVLIADDWSHVQGAGLSIRSPDWTKYPSMYGGIGFLSDGRGDDFYFASHGNCMGSSYFMSIGAFADHGGNDKYIPQGGYGLGYAVHLSNAVFIDYTGEDYYFGKVQTGGVAADRSVAIMVDYEGNDIYGPSDIFVRQEIENELGAQRIQLSKTEFNLRTQEGLADVSFGSALKPKAIGVLIDYKGNDRYFARQKGWGESLGGVMPPKDPGNWSNGMLLDLEGNDYYYKDDRVNNQYTLYFKHGLFYDTENAGDKISENSFLAFPESSNTKTQESIKGIPRKLFHDEMQDLLNPDLFVRYKAIGQLIHNMPSDYSDVADILIQSNNSELNRDLLEVLTIFIMQRNVDAAMDIKLNSLLLANDPFVRIYAARLLGWWNRRSAIPSLIEALTADNEGVRSNIIWALGKMGSAKIVDPLVNVFHGDSSLICRRSAILALERMVADLKPAEFSQRDKLIDTFKTALSDSDEVIRSHAASALNHFAENPQIILALQKHLQDPSVYVQRSAAQSIILNGVKDGIPVLIETLKFPSIDTFQHYDHELARDLAYYCGIDFPADQRYRYHTWKTWWQLNGPAVDLKQNLKIMNEILSAFRTQNEEIGIEIFERLMADHPDNKVIRNRYKRFCFEWITYRLLTRPKRTEDIWQRSIRLQKKMTRLEPDNAQVFVSLAYFHAQLKNYKNAIQAIRSAIDLDPKNRHYQNILKNYEYLSTINNNGN
jgi:hypothetical protein